jgi:hypothetical protein
MWQICKLGSMWMDPENRRKCKDRVECWQVHYFVGKIKTIGMENIASHQKDMTKKQFITGKLIYKLNAKMFYII